MQNRVKLTDFAKMSFKVFLSVFSPTSLGDLGIILCTRTLFKAMWPTLQIPNSLPNNINSSYSPCEYYNENISFNSH